MRDTLEEPGTGGGPVILEMRGVTKRFPGVVANDQVSFDLRRGEVHCIVGENGAGKTTLVNILYGLYRMDEGEILVEGQKVSIGSPRDAMGLGIGMIHQFFTLVPGLTVLENIILGREPTQGPFLDLERAKEEILRLQERFDLRVDLDVEPGQLAAGQRQKVEILKALYRGAKILVMDEPTSVLTPEEKEALIRNLRMMAEGGDLSIIFITHKLPEAVAASDRITILRKGRVVDTVEAGRVDQGALAQKMVGRDVLFEAA
ncbi:MAG: ATP-binding cassette domain-containing protein, partial [Candidatus Bathyarchaeota archaeon]|nr:ATP-binding cassette domain-containing protein [Candidatus Bathyarchaeota archaeon]